MVKPIDLRNICAKCGGNHNTGVHPIRVSKPKKREGFRCAICGRTKGHDALKHESRRPRKIKCPLCGSLNHSKHPTTQTGQFISGTVSQFSNGKSVQ